MYEKDSMFGRAMKIGQLEALGFSWRDDDAIDRQLDAVTPAAVQAVAKRYLTDDRLTAAVLLPQALPAGQVAAPTLNGGACSLNLPGCWRWRVVWAGLGWHRRWTPSAGKRRRAHRWCLCPAGIIRCWMCGWTLTRAIAAITPANPAFLILP